MWSALVFCYYAYNLRISSQVELPHLPQARSGDDILIKLTPPDAQAGPPPGMNCAFHVTPRLATLDYADLGTLTVREGRRIEVTLRPDAREELLPHYLTGEAMAALLYQRGLLVLQACAIAIQGMAAVFLAGHGGGKSVLAAKLHQEGHTLLAEDVTAIDLRAGRPLVIPAVPMLRLDQESAAALGREPAWRQPAQFHAHKAISVVERGFADTPVPLRVVYRLQAGADNTIGCIPIQAGATVVRYHSYPDCLLQPGGIDHLQRCSILAGSVPVCAITRRHSLQALPELVEMIERHMTSRVLA
jgi:hypothetical protein